MKSFSQSFGAVDSESSNSPQSTHRGAMRLFWAVTGVMVAAALLPVIPAAAKAPAPQVSSAASAYTGVNPTRVMDTRTGSGIVGAGNTLGPGASFSLVVAPNATAGVPANATAVVMNVTATDTTAASWLTVYPNSGSLPFASNLNWVAGYTVPNLVTVQPGTGGQVTFYNKFGSVDVIADIAGYFAPPSGSAGGEVGAGFPQRLVDTRAGSGSLGAGSAIGPAATATYQVTGNAGVPASGVSAVILNATVTNTTAASFLTLWAAGATRNTVSNDNWVAGWTRANRAIVPVSSTGQISVYNQFGSVDVILDVDGYFTNASASGALFTSVAPVRLADHTALGPNSSFDESVTGRAGVPANATAAMLNSTVSETTAPSFLTSYPTGGTRPNTSDINWVAGQVNPNLGVSTLGTGGMSTFYNSAGNVNVTIDLEGFFGAAAGVTVTANPMSIPANGGGTGGHSTVTAHVTQANGNPSVGDPVNFTTSGGTTCGTLSGTNPTPTGSTGDATITYNSSSTAGTCTITATEANGALTGTVTITQTQVPNTVVVTFTPSDGVPADGATQRTVNAQVNSGIGANPPVASDVVTFSMAGNPAAACGTLSASTATTSAAGLATVTYTASSNTVGFCTISATEAGTGASGKGVLDQTTAPAQSFNLINLTPLTASIPGNGTTTQVITATVTNSGAPVANDLIMFTSSGASCGTLSSAFGTTNSLGQATVTYTAGTTAGSCVITGRDAPSNHSNTSTITQAQVPNTVTAVANPSSISANDTSTSTVSATVKDVSGAAVAGDVVTFASLTGGCGNFATPTATTNASGVATDVYTSSTTAAFCSVTATDTSASVGSGTAHATITITQSLATAAAISLTASKSSIPADGVTTSTLTATVTDSSSGAVNGDPVSFSSSGSPAAACGTFGTPSGGGLTNGSGVVTVVYTAGTTVGSCTITATEANGSHSANTTITQTLVKNTVTVSFSATGVPANGTANSTVTATVLSGSGTHPPVANGDVVTFTMSGNPAAACGTLSSATAPVAGGAGAASVTYTASVTIGFCTVTATEAGTGGSGTGTLAQTTVPAQSNTLTVSPLTASKAADGAATQLLTYTALSTGAGTPPVPGDLVMFIMTGSTCGTLSAASGITNASGQVTVTYTTGTTAGACSVSGREANGNTTTTAPSVITQTQVANTVTVAANPSAVSVSAAATSTVTATVKDVTGAAVAGDTVSFSDPSTCGTFNSTGTPHVQTAVTNAAGVATVTYTAAGSTGFCLVTATDTGPSAGAIAGANNPGTITITQTI